MWGTFQEVRCSPPFKMWETFLSDNLSVIASPNFYQYITYAFFRSMIYEHFAITSSDNSKEGKADIEKNDDIQFYWCLFSVGWADNTVHTTLGLIIDLYITIRGFQLQVVGCKCTNKPSKRLFRSQKELEINSYS